MTVARRLLAIGAIAIISAVVLIAAAQMQRHDGYFSPVFGPDGRDVYFIGRQTGGLVAGLGWENFTPPAYVFVWHDTFSLRRLRRDTGEVEVLATLPPSPVEGRRLRTYRGRAFVAPSTLLRRVDDRLEFRIRLSIAAQPTAEQHFLSGVWEQHGPARDGAARWTQEWVALSGGDLSPLFENLEVIAARGNESFPCAVVAHDALTGTVETLIENDDCPDLYPAGIAEADVIQFSRRANIERIDELTSTHDRLMNEALAAGMSEHQAGLHVLDQMRDLGYYPQPPELTAHLLGPAQVETHRAEGRLDPLFVIEEMQFTVGLFQDLERALDTPGTSVEKTGRYAIHNAYTTSQALNGFFDGGGRRFFVQRGANVFEVELTDGG